ncbi:right-handed parallel beta-helix repeat-containing protein [Chitinophagaceae bacterium LB-8]|uniref:Right-handed parallel beta-helix repeat-containing protein n=1 Tax=Paraflavisolibacter caeni TaxID=2982496 RepID=A0A9X2XP69_9BACT|nr:right-handed parallel beta-helix repeat-containing protein [Paraflavisolibacter caeni]MCU7550094.1 right-handed parallel beta-helix repeat-containing protein [Paraflavisolibacter caeni]
MSNKILRLLFILIVAVLVSAKPLVVCSAFGNTYYVANNGNDSNPGTLERPLKTLRKVNEIKLKAGDTILFKGGETFDGMLELIVQGSNNKPVVISSYEKGAATINGGNKEAIIIKGSYFQLSNINARGAGRKTGNSTNGVSLIEASYASIENVNTQGFQKSGLDLYDCNSIQVKNVYALENGFSGINIGGSDKKKSRNILVKNCNAENNPGDPTMLENHSGNGILIAHSDSVTIDHCTATNNGWDMPRIGNGPVGIWAYESDHVLIQYCISYRNRTAKGAKDGGGFDLDGGVTNSVIQYCLSYENEGAGYGLFQYAGASLWYNNTVRYCISINDATSTEGSGGIFFWNGSDDSVQLADCIVHNNLVYSTHAPAIEFEPSSKNKNIFLYNNIFIGAEQIVNGPSSGEKFIGNVWWTTGGDIRFRGYKNLFVWADETGQEKWNGQLAGRQIDPLLKGPFTTKLIDPNQLHTLTNYTLQSSSPLINTGLNLKALFENPTASHDFYGTPIPQGINPEPGVFEWKEN